MEQDRARLIEDERKKMRRLRLIVDLTTGVLYQDPDLTLPEARELVSGLRRAALRMFPGKERTFEIVLRPRFDRILRERWGSGLDSRTH